MLRIAEWSLVWILMILWCVSVRPFLPGLLVFEPCLPLLVMSLMLGPLRIVVPFILFAGLVFDAFQPFPHPMAFIGLLGVSLLVGLAVRFLLASRSFYSALLLVVSARLVLVGFLALMGPGAALWAGDRAIVAGPLFFVATTLIDALLLLLGFRLVSKPLLGAKRVQIAQ